MRPAPLLVLLLSAALAGGAVTQAPDASAQPKKAAKAKKSAKGKKKGKKGKEEADEEETPATDEAASESSELKGKEESGKPAAAGTKKGSGGGGGGPSVVETKGQDGGVKTYKFGPVEVEGRLKSPQVVYFLRRVRAEFAAGALGHRSFLGELSDTRRNPALK